MSETRETTQRRVYVLPSELVERIVEFQSDKNLPSEVEAVRRLLDEALKFRDTPENIVVRFRERLRSDRIPSSVARDVLVGHPQIEQVGFHERDAVTFRFRDHGEFRIDADGDAFRDGNTGYGEPHWVPFPDKPSKTSNDDDDEIPF